MNREETRPNILLIVTDHQLHYRHGWDGGQGPLRPQFDSLGEQGLCFDRAYCVSPLCGPARRSLLSGMYPHNHRNFYNQSDVPFIQDTYLDTLYTLGYDNYYYGKWHAGPGNALEHDCEGFSPSGYGNPYITPEYDEYLQRLGLPKATHRIDRLFWHNDTHTMFPGLQEGATGYRCDKSWCGETAFGITETPKETHECFFLADLACGQLQRLAQEDSSRPFHMRVDFWGPHQPYFPTQEYLDLYDARKITQYGNFTDDLCNKPATYRHMNRPIADEVGNMIVPSVFSWEQWQQMLVYAYAQTTMVDDAVGTIMHTLESLGFGDNTLVIYTSDHGDALASHGGMFDKGSFMTEETIRIPLAMRHPKLIQPRRRSNALVNTIDIAPTILAYAGADPCETVDGDSLLPILTGEKDSIRSDMLLESYGQGYRDKLMSRTLINADYKFTWNEQDIDELYHLSTDPYEMQNLQDHPEFQGIRRDMKKRLQELMAWYNDTDMPV